MSTLLSSNVKIFLAYIKAIFTNGPRHSPTKSPDLIIIIHTYIYHTYIYIYIYIYISTLKLFARRIVPFLVLPITFGDSLRATPVHFYC